jgi:murein DD-endopeptidase MepM/ murein hydrolase activator NlpD
VTSVRLAFVVLAALVAATGASQDAASDPEVAVLSRQIPGGVELTLQNDKTHEVTVTTTMTLENMRADVTLPLTATYPARAATRLARLSIVDRTQPWRWRHHFDWVPGVLDATAHDDAVYLLPYERGRSFRVLQGEGAAFSHTGAARYAIDWAMPEGTRVYAARTGLVVVTRDTFSEGGADESLRERSNYVKIRQDDGTIAEYVHFRQGGVAVASGDHMSAGDLIGYSGNVGYSTEPHLHLAVYKAVDGKTRASLPMRFRTQRGVQRLHEGERYAAVR